ncbi:amidohydrolase family protein [Candidatus Nitrospira allomarina]|uniref:Amidohydrolase family protein n=1 Tax=Candidatus Nitrospira allomarina TaxID=3020900 RepID=A0AA96GGJ3_9BACT|nr:amidohydrolase family protein [Candidatus Nitrospira allomarina]WNM58488.1 amidohydrolase family protein [Candidatus Nitrospira allomarina]
MSRTSTYFLRAMLFAVSAFCVSCDLLGGAFDHEPKYLEKKISAGARSLIEQAFEGIQGDALRDYHVHMLGMNEAINGTFVNEEWQSPWSGLTHFFQFEIYKSAAVVTDEQQADAQYLSRLKGLIQFMPERGKFGIMAFDFFHDEQGQPHRELSTFYVPNEYVMTIARKNPEIFFPIISIHPYREDATIALRHYAQQGVRFVKWLPNAMGIHPASETMQNKLVPFYRIMKEYDMVLISHTGVEVATEAEEFQRFGNPWLLKKPLDMGVKVVMAHVASLGECEKHEETLCPPGTPYIDLAIQMLEDPKYTGLVFADISALTQYNRHHNLDKILSKPSIHSRLINGSDYPLPAINIVIRTRSLVSSGHINSEEREALNEIYDYNPLLFDFVLKRTLRHSKTGKKFPPSVFVEHPDLPTG